MNKQKVHSTLRHTPIDQQDKPSFYKRFALLCESVFIILVTAVAAYSTRFVDVPELVMQLSAQQQRWQLSEILTLVSIFVFGLLVLLMRYSNFLRKKIKQQRHVEEDFKRLAFFDPLTKLPNKALCHDRLEHAITRAAINNTSIAVLFIAIDDFKAVNQKQGNDVGDIILQEVAKRLSRELSSSATSARISGVEFLIIIEALSPQDNIMTFAERLLKKVVKCYRISMQEMYITANIGIAMYPKDAEHSKELIRNADTAMCFSKEQGINAVSFFSKELQEQVNTKKKIAKQLQHALEEEEFSLHYQPIIDANTYNIIGVEALLRWHNKQLGDMAPDVFIPIAEEMGIISKIGDWVLTKACQQNKNWHQLGFQNLVMSVNLSAMEFCLKNCATIVGASLAAAELEPQFLELEFTEDTLMRDIKKSLTQLKILSGLGVSIALDDFGTGYSSMQYLPKFPLNRLKIDGKFIKNIPTNVVDTTIIRGITVLAKQFNLQITAEGVETAQQCQFIEECTIDAIQGYHFSQPLTAEAFTVLLQAPPWQAKLPTVNE